MRIWFITIGEPVPLESNTKERVHRTGQFAQAFAKLGHDVTWWTSTFDHRRKKILFDKTTVVKPIQNLKIILLNGYGYKKNISFERIKDEMLLAKEFNVHAENEPRPDLIVCGFPPIYLSAAAVKFAKTHKIPVVVDGRDMWPDIFSWIVPRFARPVANLALLPLSLKRNFIFSNASAISGITDEFVDWGVANASRKRQPLDRAIPFGYSATPLPEEDLAQATNDLIKLGFTADDGFFNVVFIGTIANTLDVDTILSAAEDPVIRQKPIRFVMVGIGDKFEFYKKRSATLENVMWTGWLNAAQISIVMKLAHVGLDPMPNRFDFLATINNKAIEYMHGKLPIISSPNQGILKEFIAKNEIGFSYNTGESTVLAEQILRLFNDRVLRDRLAEHSFQCFSENFDLRKVVEMGESYFNQVIESTR